MAHYTWDCRNRLFAIEIFDETTGDPVRVVANLYDTFNRRIARLVDEGADETFEDIDNYYYDGDDVVLVLDEAGNVDHRYLHGPAVDMILADEAYSPTTHALEDVYWTVADRQGSVRDVLTFNGTHASVHEQIAYDAYGRIAAVYNGSTLDTTLTPTVAYAYTGREWDAAIGMQYSRARWFIPELGKWASKDPIGFEAGDANLYRYVFGSPTNASDPFGGEGVGHHWVPIAVLQVFWDQLSEEAKHTALGAYSGPTDPPHCFGTYGGVTHAKYNEIVKEQLKAFIGEKKSLSASQMQEFVELVRTGRNADGTANKYLKCFNDAISDSVIDGKGASTDIKDRINAGTTYRKNPRFKNWVIGATIASGMGFATDAIAGAPEALNSCSQSPHMRQAMDALNRGDIGRAHSLLVGAKNSVYDDMVFDGVDWKYSQAFRKHVDDAFKRGQSCDIK